MTKKLRNRLLALLCLLAFVGLGFVFFFTWVVQKPFALILFVADGLDTGSLTAARIYAAGAEHPLRLESLPNLALLRNFANDYAVPDPASAATAFSTGRKVNNGSLAVDPSGASLETLLETARKKGRATGLISNVSILDAGAAAFYAHSRDATDRQALAAMLVDEFTPDVVFGGGEEDFLPDVQGGKRTDGRDLTLEMRRKGFDIVRTRSELENTPPWRGPSVFALLNRGDLAFVGEIREREAQPTLDEMVRDAIQFLQFNQKGYVLVVHVGLIEKAARMNETERMLREIMELDRAVRTAIEYAGDKALIVVAGKQGVGGLRMNGYPLRNDKGVATLGINPQGLPSAIWATGPAGPKDEPPQESPAEAEPSPPATRLEVAAVFTPHAQNVAEDTIALSIGPGSEKLRGFIDNTRVYDLLKENL